MNDRRAIADIRIGSRHRKELGDLAGLAASIAAEGLLQPIGVTAGGELVFGERRLKACADQLGWTEIDVRIVPVSSIAAGEFAENELRKDFTPSERVAILETIERMKHGGDRKSDQRPPVADALTASKAVGFGSKAAANYARRVVREGVPELVAAMDRGAIGIRPAAALARLPEAEQRAAIGKGRRGLSAADREARTERRRREQEDREVIAARTERRRRERKPRKVTIPWSAKPAGRILLERWPPSLCRDLIAVLQEGLAGAAPKLKVV